MLEASARLEAMTCWEPAQDWRPCIESLEARSRRETIVEVMHRQKRSVTPQNTDSWKLGQPRGLMTCKETGTGPEASYGGSELVQ